MHKIDFKLWKPVKKGGQFVPQGRSTKIVLEKPGSVTVHNGKDSYVAGYGTEFHLEGYCSGITCSENGSATMPGHGPIDGLNEAPFTNINKIPGQSAEVQAVTLALRRLKSEEKRIQREMNEQSTKMLLEKGHIEPEPEPEEDATPDETEEEENTEETTE